MRATVTYPYRDREDGAVHIAGEAVELGAARFAELSQRGFVEAGCPEADQEAPAPGGSAERSAAQQAPEPSTVAQLSAAIEAKGGYAPKKATKAQLQAILGSLR